MHRRLVTLALAAAACGDNQAPNQPDAGVLPDGPGAVADAAPDADPRVDFTETYETGTQDVGNWGLSTNPARPRMIEPTGGNPNAFLYSEVSTAIPTWS